MKITELREIDKDEYGRQCHECSGEGGFSKHKQATKIIRWLDIDNNPRGNYACNECVLESIDLEITYLKKQKEKIENENSI